jgi:hypothetical protein
MPTSTVRIMTAARRLRLIAAAAVTAAAAALRRLEAGGWRLVSGRLAAAGSSPQVIGANPFRAPSDGCKPLADNSPEESIQSAASLLETDL